MDTNEAYRIAEERIAIARQQGETVLDLSNLGLTEVPDAIAQLTSLQGLSLNNNQLSELPEAIAQLTSLQGLYLSGNQLSEVPEAIAQLTSLQRLDLDNNQLSEVPEAIAQLTSLQRLDLDNNQLSEVPEAIAQLTSLQRLDLHNNQLSEVPEAIAQLTSLQRLDLHNNQLSEVPEAISQLTSLQRLYLHNNQLSEVPEAIAQLTSLQQLDLDNNQLSEVPEAIAQLTSLQWLYLNNNQLSEVPEAIAQLTSLQELSLNNNPLNPELEAAYEQGLDAVKTYLQALAEDKVILNEAKLILVGEGEVGKTCLLGALRGDEWVEGRLTTHGIQIKPVEVIHPNGNKEIVLNGWDFGGQRVYRPTHQLFFTAPAVYLVVWKPREGPQQGFVNEWITLIKHREPDAKILVVATHGGPSQRQPDIDRQELIDKFSTDTIQGFFFIDSKPHPTTGECRNIPNLKQAIAQVAATLPGMGRTIPAAWYRVREALRVTNQPYLTYNQVMDICAEQGVEGFLADLCLRVFHTLGHLIHYHYDPLLKDIVILKPDWLAKAISFALDDKQIRDNNGLVQFDYLSQLWENPPFEEETGYPKDLHRLFLKLMERFDLSYQVVDPDFCDPHNPTSLIAQLVDDQRPDSLPWDAEIPDGKHQKIQICRIVDDRGQLAKAEGLFYRLIVRFHKYSLGRDNYTNSVHWQRGLILDDNHNGRAFLEYIDTNIRITVRAAYPEFFLNELTKDVKWLVEHFWEGLRCEIVVPCIEPCGKSQPGLGQFEVEKLIASKEKGHSEYPCNVSGCDEWQNIDALIRNTTAAQTSPELTLNQLLQNQALFLQRISDLEQLGQESLANDQRLRSQLDEQFTQFIQMFNDEAKEGPRLFSLERTKTGFLDRPKAISIKVKLTLWCEHSRKPLPELNEDKTKGVYLLDVPREWFTKAKPYLTAVTRTIGLIVPVVSSAGKWLMEDTAYNDIAEEWDVAQKGIAASAKGGDLALDWASRQDAPNLEHGREIEAQGSVLRQLHSFLKEKDPTFGGLVRVQNRQYKYLWVHENFVDEY
ncbi:leucine-rich repeat domain-containing protein [Roseofilum casamattae]|uniref:non-specific serine/threonine protein kinase n=1 Tax=Roseofilum casamattae BLCC-M143 TaxID=3022442 RepID=A0ABT7C0D3_9CYAN|nr:leucine-rich repeat domain-containing protein [Roseofilum casamattae]MDJ1183968.1 COR domain-containing protein [Roseofilum casamattae BLCC-M143]